jgi:hypothetical protein
MISRWRPTLISNDRQPAWALGLKPLGGGRPASTAGRPSGFDPLVPRVRRADWQGAANIIVREHGRQLIGRGIADAVEMGEAAVPCRKRQHGHHAVDRRNKRPRRSWLPWLANATSGAEKIGQRLQVGGRAAADVAAVGQDLDR